MDDMNYIMRDAAFKIFKGTLVNYTAYCILRHSKFAIEKITFTKITKIWNSKSMVYAYYFMTWRLVYIWNEASRD